MHGKTLLAKAVASDAAAHFLTVSLSRLVHSGVGQSSKAIRDLFDSASRCQPAVIFLDEIDAVFGKRGGDQHGSQLVSQLLLEFENIAYIHKNISVTVLAATNRPWALDSALFSPGRFDRIIYIGLPDVIVCFIFFQILVLFFIKILYLTNL
eukprot:GSMAST32.ASY1.ANO1.332.1 assembled CDS